MLGEAVPHRLDKRPSTEYLSIFGQLPELGSPAPDLDEERAAALRAATEKAIVHMAMRADKRNPHTSPGRAFHAGDAAQVPGENPRQRLLTVNTVRQMIRLTQSHQRYHCL